MKNISGVWEKDLVNALLQTPVLKILFFSGQMKTEFFPMFFSHKYIAVSEGF